MLKNPNIKILYKSEYSFFNYILIKKAWYDD